LLLPDPAMRDPMEVQVFHVHDHATRRSTVQADFPW
jgi:hypothetical protein